MAILRITKEKRCIKLLKMAEWGIGRKYAHTRRSLNFNLYEEADFCWSIQLIGASCFDEEEEDWCCEETFCSGENRFSWKEHAEWEEILNVSCKMIRQYISNGKYAEALKKYEAIAAGFVDGDLEILYQR